ncbi:hypothetical protein ACLOJK_024553 [Asimina triloba]
MVGPRHFHLLQGSNCCLLVISSRRKVLRHPAYRSMRSPVKGARDDGNWRCDGYYWVRLRWTVGMTLKWP